MEENTTGIDWERVSVKVSLIMRPVSSVHVLTQETFRRCPNLV